MISDVRPPISGVAFGHPGPDIQLESFHEESAVSSENSIGLLVVLNVSEWKEVNRETSHRSRRKQLANGDHPHQASHWLPQNVYVPDLIPLKPGYKSYSPNFDTTHLQSFFVVFPSLSGASLCTYSSLRTARTHLFRPPAANPPSRGVLDFPTFQHPTTHT